MLSYKKPPIEDEPDVVPIVFTTILPPTSTTTMGHGLKWWMLVAIVAGMLLLVLAGGTVVQRDGASYMTIAEGLLVAMAANDDDCLPAVGTFSGTSMTTDLGEDDHFETCYQYGNASLYCWTKSYYDKHQGCAWSSISELEKHDRRNTKHNGTLEYNTDGSFCRDSGLGVVLE